MVTRAFLIQAPIRIQGAHRVFPWGPFTYDVRTGGGGVGSKADDSTGKLREWDSDKGEWGPKSQKHHL